MAQYIFARFRDPAASGDVLGRLSDICAMLAPESIRDDCQNTAAGWQDVPGAYYGIQNSSAVDGPEAGALVIGWINRRDGERGAQPPGVEADGSYAVIKAVPGSVSFFTDQFGSRTLWYYLDDDVLVVSTSQRAIVRFKGSFVPNPAATAWFLSSGCQGPFISWDQQISQVRPELEYVLDVQAWRLHPRPKTGMELPRSGSQPFDEYVNQFQQQVIGSLGRIVGSRPQGETLLPLSGGLDSRTLLALSVPAGVAADVQLVNWGVKQTGSVFDDKAAAHQVAASYNKPLLDCYLPEEVDDHGRVLDLFVEASEGRIDHFNAYTDGFSMWAEFYRRGFRQILRGEIPFPTASYVDDASARSQVGLSAFSDFSNLGEEVKPFGEVQVLPDVSRNHGKGESLITWRDRLYASYRIPMITSAFADLVSGYVESCSPMMSWSLFKGYMALPDGKKGNKKHIEAVWRRNDESGVPSHAVGSLLPPAALFGNTGGRRFLLDYLVGLHHSESFQPGLVAVILAALESQPAGAQRAGAPSQLRSMRAWLSDRLPAVLKAHIKARRPRHLAPEVLAYRLVLADKIGRMYATDAGRGPGRDWASPGEGEVRGVRPG